MSGITLVVTRAVNLIDRYKRRFGELGFKNVIVTIKDKDGLLMQIRELKPDIIIIGASFYKCCTPYMVGELLKDTEELYRDTRGLYIGAVAIGEYPVDLGMYFLVNGAKAYVCSRDGEKQFFEGIEAIRNRRKYEPETVLERRKIRLIEPQRSVTITKRQIEVIRCICNGFSDIEAADTLAISKRTVNNDKFNIFSSLCIRNEKELIRTALTLGFVTEDELRFYGRDYVLKPTPPKKLKYRGIR